MPEAGGA